MPLFPRSLKIKLDIFIETKNFYNPKSYIANNELISDKRIGSLKQMIRVSILCFCTTIIQLQGEYLSSL